MLSARKKNCGASGNTKDSFLQQERFLADKKHSYWIEKQKQNRVSTTVVEKPLPQILEQMLPEKCCKVDAPSRPTKSDFWQGPKELQKLYKEVYLRLRWVEEEIT